MKYAMVRWIYVPVYVTLVTELSLAYGEFGNTGLSFLEVWQNPVQKNAIDDWQPLVITKWSENDLSQTDQLRSLNTHSQQKHENSQSQLYQNLANLPSSKPVSIIADEENDKSSKLLQKKSYQIISQSSVNGFEPLAAPSLLGAFNSIGLGMVQARIPTIEKRSKNNLISEYSNIATFPGHQAYQISPKLISGHLSRNGNAFLNKQEILNNQNSRYQPLLISPNHSTTSVQIFPPRSNSAFVNDAYYMHHSSHNREQNNFDAHVLPRKQTQSSYRASMLSISNNIPTIYGTRDTFNLPTVYKPAPFSKNQMFEEYTYVTDKSKHQGEDKSMKQRNTFADSTLNIRHSISNGKVPHEEPNSSQHVFHQLSKYGRPFSVTKDSRDREYERFHPEIPRPINQDNSTVKLGKFAIRNNFKTDNSKSQPQYIPVRNNIKSQSVAISSTSDNDFSEYPGLNKLPSHSFDHELHRPNEQYYRTKENQDFPFNYQIHAPAEDNDSKYKGGSVKKNNIFLPTLSYNYNDYDSGSNSHGFTTPTQYTPVINGLSQHKYAGGNIYNLQEATTYNNVDYSSDAYSERTRTTSSPSEYQTGIYQRHADNTTPYVATDKNTSVTQKPYTNIATTKIPNKNRKQSKTTVKYDEFETSQLTDSLIEQASYPLEEQQNMHFNYDKYDTKPISNSAFLSSSISQESKPQYHSRFNENSNLNEGLNSEGNVRTPSYTSENSRYQNQHKSVQNIHFQGDKLSNHNRNLVEQQNEDTFSSRTVPSSTEDLMTTSAATVSVADTATQYSVGSQKPKEKYRSSTRPKFSVKDYRHRPNVPFVTTESVEKSAEQITEKEKKSTRKSLYEFRNKKKHTGENETNSEQTPPSSTIKYKSRTRPSRYKTTSTTISSSPLEVSSVTTERINTFRPTGTNRYKSGGKIASKYHTTTEPYNNDIEDSSQSSSTKHIVRTKPLFSAKKNAAIKLSPVADVQTKVNLDENEKSNLAENYSPYRKGYKYKTNAAKISEKSDDELGITIMTSSEEISWKPDNNTAVPGDHSEKYQNDSDASFEYYDNDDDDGDASNTTILPMASDSESTAASTRLYIRSSSMSRHQPSFATDDSVPPVDAFFRSWMNNKKNKKLP